jgi:hypothetical protein
MRVKFTIAAAGLFAAFFIYGLMTARTIFDAAWFFAVTSIPASLAADIISRSIAGIFGDGRKNIYIDLILLFVLGAFQYGLIGYVIGWFVDKIRSSKFN